jgi:hypothetical protein
MTDVVDGFIELFQGRTDAIGTEEGGCFRPGPPFEGNLYYWKETVERHLKGIVPIGVYPMVPFPVVQLDPNDAPPDELTIPRADIIGAEWRVRWGCIDFDEGDEPSFVYARNVHAVLGEFGITAWIERSRSKGYHVWCFADEWVPARTMRRALLAACQIVGAPTKEINPKSEELKEGQLGNYLRCPYPGGLRNAHTLHASSRRVMLDEQGNFYLLHTFVEQALASRTNASALEQVAALFKPKPRPLNNRKVDDDIQNADVDAIKRLSGLAHTIWKDGPKEGADRSTTLWKLATLLHEDGNHTFPEALELMNDADQRWGKHHDKGHPEYVELTLEKAWYA